MALSVNEIYSDLSASIRNSILEWEMWTVDLVLTQIKVIHWMLVTIPLNLQLEVEMVLLSGRRVQVHMDLWSKRRS